MDDLYTELKNFISSLDVFNESTNKNWDELQREWQYADELWQDDQARQRFEKEFGELGNLLRIYREQYGQAYLKFLIDRQHALEEYFGY